MDKSEIASLTVSVVGVLVSIGGFALAYHQLRRTADATVATQAAMERTEQRMALNHLLVLLPQFQAIEASLDRACEADDRPSAIAALSTCTRVSSELSGVLLNVETAGDGLVDRLRNLSESASAAKNLLVEAASNRKVHAITSSVRQLLSETSAQIAESGATYRTSIVTERMAS